MTRSSLSSKASTVRLIAHSLTVALLMLSCVTANALSKAEKPKPGAAARVSGVATLALTREFLAYAPKRFNGSPGHAKAEQFIKAHFSVEDLDHRFLVDTFSASTPAGQQTMHNLIVKYPGKKDGIIVLGTHYETNFPLKDTAFVGANDGACTSALLIEIGEYFRTHPPDGYTVWLVFFDGEEAVKEWGPSDSLYGSRHLAAKWSQDGTIGHIKAFLNADMIGDKNLDISRDSNSSPVLASLLDQAAKNTGHTNALSRDSMAWEDDTVPFAKRGVPVLDVIDGDYGPHTRDLPDGYHHTPQDTIDKISAQSLQTSADLFMDLIKLINQR